MLCFRSLDRREDQLFRGELKMRSGRMSSGHKDELFWKALLTHKLGKKKPKKKHQKLTNAAELATQFGIDKKDVERVYNIFVAMDDDGSGTISSSEVAAMLMGFGVDVSPKVVQAVMRTSDKNGDGEINFDEFLAAVTSKVKANNEADIQVMLERLNEHANVSAEELAVAWKETLKSKATAIITATTTNNNTDKSPARVAAAPDASVAAAPKVPPAAAAAPVKEGEVDALCGKFITMSQTV